MNASQMEAYVANRNGFGCWIQLPISSKDLLKTVTDIDVTDPGKNSLQVTIVEPKLEILLPHLTQPFNLNKLTILLLIFSLTLTV